jgi:hypothetical protein
MDTNYYYYFLHSDCELSMRCVQASWFVGKYATDVHEADLVLLRLVYFRW